jgi:cell division protein FtsI/penicillin-binding protein 2
MLKKMLKNKTNSKHRKSRFEQYQNRILILAILWLVGFVIVLYRLYQVQILNHEVYLEKSKAFSEKKRTIQAARGTIVDRNGEALAMDLMHYSLAVRPKKIVNKKTIAQKISKITHLSYKEVYSKLNSNKNFVYLAHRLTPEQAAQLNRLTKGIVLERKFSRTYPFNEVGAHVIGYCDNDNQAGAGLELSYDLFLRGKDGVSVFLRDAKGGVFPDLDYPAVEPQNGKNIETTIDIVYQGILETELSEAIRKHNADNGSAVLMNPRTGEVLAMANYPTYNPNFYYRYPIKNFRNQAISDLYEPGSTFKMISLALCLEYLRLNMDKELVFCENGSYRLAQKTVRDHQKFAYLTARQVFENSSNVGTIKLAERFPDPEFYRCARDFGFGNKTGIDLPGEINGVLHKPSEFSKYSVAYMSIGYEVGVTALQITAAYAAVANDGLLLQPYVVKRVIDQSGRVVKENKPTVIRRVISEETARQMKLVLQGVVENGTGKNASVEGVTVAGKTGTAQKIDRTTNSYTSNQHIASFAGFFPVENPKFVLLVIVNNPRKGGYYGSQVAAPVFKRIAQQIVGLSVEKEPVSDINLAKLNFRDELKTLPLLEGMATGNAKKMLNKLDLDYQIIGDGDTVTGQTPQAFSRVDENQTVFLYTSANHQTGTTSVNVMPNIVGKSLREALRIISDYNKQIDVNGSGVVREQFPKAGEKLDHIKKISLNCSPS